MRLASESPLARVTVQRREFVAGVIAALIMLAAILMARLYSTGPAASPAPTVVRSLVVLPLQGQPADPDMDFLGAGVASEVATALEAVPGLRVARTPSADVFDARLPGGLRELTGLLNVGSALSGSLRRVDNEFRLTLQLMSATDEAQLWSATFTRDTSELVELENTAAAAVARVLRGQLDLPPSDAPPTAVAVRTRDHTAHMLFMRAAYIRRHATRSALDSAITLLQAAVSRDSSYARAWSELASALVTRSDSAAIDVRAARRRATDAARRAIARDRSLAEPHVVLGRLHSARANSDQALRELRTAIRLDPRSASARYEYSRLLMRRGEIHEAVREARRSHELDPLSAALHLNYVFMLQRAGRESDARHETGELRRISHYLESHQ